MASNYAARAATANDITAFRSGKQFTELGLLVQIPQTVYTCRINQTFTTTDAVSRFITDTVTGNFADIEPNMIAYVSALDFGRWEKGIVRIRKTSAPPYIDINPTSGIQFADNDFITIVDAFPIMQRDYFSGTSQISMDTDLVFSSALGGAIPRIAPVAAVLQMPEDNTPVTFTPPDPTGSMCYDGATIVSYLYDAPLAINKTGMNTSSPSWQYNAGTNTPFRWSCTITDSLGRTVTAYRWVWVVQGDSGTRDFELAAPPAGDFESGDWSFSVNIYGNDLVETIPPRAMVTLFARDYYDGVEGSIGRLTGYENLIATGWVDEESITRDNETGNVNLTVHGANYWLSKIRAFPFELSDVSGTPTAWRQIQNMTVDKALAYLLQWTSTATTMMDCYFTGNETRIKLIAQPAGNLLSQINAIAENTVFAKCLTNSLQQMYVEIDTQIADSTARASIPTVMDITSADYIAPLDIERVRTPKAAMIELGGIAEYDGNLAPQVNSRAPGTLPDMYGDIASADNYIFFNQDECNRISGALLAMRNNDYEPIDITLAANNRLFDFVPRMYGTLTVGIPEIGDSFTAQKIIPRSVRYSYTNGVLIPTITFEVETTGVDGVTYVPPSGDTNPDYSIGDTGFSTDFPSLDLGTDFPPVTPTETLPPCDETVYNSFPISWDANELIGNASPLISKAFFPCVLRSTGSSVLINGYWYGDAATHFNVYGIKGGARVITGSLTFITPAKLLAYFNPPSNLEVDGFEIELDAGAGSIITYEAGDIVASGTVDATDSNGTYPATIGAVVAGELYSIEGTGSAWLGDETDDPQRSYTIQYSTVFPLAWSFAFGYRQIVNGGDLVWVTGGSPLYEEQIYPYGRRYFYALTNGVLYVRVGSTTFDDNSGSTGYIVRSASISGRRMSIGVSSVGNVCGVGT